MSRTVDNNSLEFDIIMRNYEFGDVDRTAHGDGFSTYLVSDYSLKGRYVIEMNDYGQQNMYWFSTLSDACRWQNEVTA